MFVLPGRIGSGWPVGSVTACIPYCRITALASSSLPYWSRNRETNVMDYRWIESGSGCSGGGESSWPRHRRSRRSHAELVLRAVRAPRAAGNAPTLWSEESIFAAPVLGEAPSRCDYHMRGNLVGNLPVVLGHEGAGRMPDGTSRLSRDGQEIRHFLGVYRRGRLPLDRLPTPGWRLDQI